ncbi:stage II sporulation protein M [Heyndrickxia shackletonii]|uniref:Stage II sporulation protein M n=1 Tax=Heyndrickxia shackletonii TaxID=157838 RepID=A0A0Q3WYD4_9BACI|nr:stage II sporulation protein M [Heyndrickxia shackletonii]KQL53639.1 stage II sporulation protein M [Heyndrickxia shackletonii]MBB2480932.1 stage II sporulation protein M [Bacillus sp. APMAM]NEZ00473.1 stage II sporulation protein M [Heyndrickxia shackletonii]RTZ55710.1 stage II sporulation protein M [Bacillus sp. SAJ1]
MRKKKLQSNPIITHVQEYSSIYLFVIVLFLMGIVFGAIIVNSLSPSQKDDLYYYLNQFFGVVSNDKVADSSDLFRLSFLHNIKFLGFMWLLGISIIGLPLILILLFLKGVVVGFSVGFLVNQMGWSGFLLSFATVLPQNLFIIPMFIFIAVVSVCFSLQLIRKIFVKQTMAFPLIPLFSSYVVFILIAAGAIAAAAGIEAYISPALMKSVVTYIQK